MGRDMSVKNVMRSWLPGFLAVCINNTMFLKAEVPSNMQEKLVDTIDYDNSGVLILKLAEEV